MASKCASLQHDFEFKEVVLCSFHFIMYEQYKFVCKKCQYETLMPHLYTPEYVCYLDYCLNKVDKKIKRKKKQ